MCEHEQFMQKYEEICLDTWTRSIQLLCQRITLGQRYREEVLHGHKMKGVGGVCAHPKKQDY